MYACSTFLSPPNSEVPILGKTAGSNWCSFIPDRMCVTEKQATTNDCEKLKVTGSKFNCERVTDR